MIDEKCSIWVSKFVENSQQAKLNCGSIHVITGDQFKINSNPHLQIAV